MTVTTYTCTCIYDDCVLILQLWSTYVWFDSLRPSQQVFSYVGTDLPGLKQYKARINVSCVSCSSDDTVTPLRLQPAVPRSRVKHSTTEPMCSRFDQNTSNPYAWQRVNASKWSFLIEFSRQTFKWRIFDRTVLQSHILYTKMIRQYWTKAISRVSLIDTNSATVHTSDGGLKKKDKARQFW